jgi:glycosyltransferase involved in cell wall biosynthesis
MIAKRLVQQGHRVAILCNRYSGGKEEEVIDGVQIMRIKGGLLRALRNFHYYYKHFRGIFDVVIEEAEGPAGPFFASLYVREPLIILWHQRGKKIFLNQFPLPVALLLIILDYIFALSVKGRFIVVPTLERARELIALGIDDEQIRIVNGGVELKEFVTSIHSCVKVDKPFFLVLNKIREYKCFHHAIYAFQKLLKKHPECKLVIAGRRGSYSYETRLRDLVKKTGLSEKVYFFINISEEEKFWLLSNAHALIVPSPVEGFSLVAVEANSVGTPVIASDGVPSEVVSHGINGLIYPFGNIDALAETMMRLLEDENLRQQLSKNAHRLATRFTWERSARAFGQVLTEAILDQNRRAIKKLNRVKI